MDWSSIVEAQHTELEEAVRASRTGVKTVAKMAGAVIDCLNAGGKILTAGNGGSAADALHMAEELVGRYRSNRRSLPAICLSADVTAVTCIGNDFGYDAIFSRQIEGLGAKGDVIVLFTSSGNSRNLVTAAESARARGLKVLIMSGKEGGALRGLGDLEWIVPARNGARVQEMHTWAMHCILEAVEAAFPAGDVLV